MRCMFGLTLIAWWVAGTVAEVLAAVALHESHPTLAAALATSALFGVVGAGVALIAERD